MIPRRIRVPKKTLDLLILRALALEPQPQYGWTISHRIHEICADKFLIQQGSLYPALHRLENRGWIKGQWGKSGRRQPVKYYSATEKGRKQIQVENDSWEKLAATVAQMLEAAGPYTY